MRKWVLVDWKTNPKLTEPYSQFRAITKLMKEIYGPQLRAEILRQSLPLPSTKSDKGYVDIPIRKKDDFRG